MAGVNKVILIGNLGKDPEVRYMPNGGAVSNISLATSETWKDNNGEKQERTEWHNIVFFEKLAEIAANYLRKGSKIYVEGKLQTKKWQDKEGNDRYTTQVVVRTMQMLDGKKHDEDGSAQQNSQSMSDDFSDDIPFMRMTNEYCY